MEAKTEAKMEEDEKKEGAKHTEAKMEEDKKKEEAKKMEVEDMEKQEEAKKAEAKTKEDEEDEEEELKFVRDLLKLKKLLENEFQKQRVDRLVRRRKKDLIMRGLRKLGRTLRELRDAIAESEEESMMSEAEQVVLASPEDQGEQGVIEAENKAGTGSGQ